MTDLWITITIIGVATYAARVLPLFWFRWNSQDNRRSSWLNRLGPCLLAAMAVAVILPTFADPKEPLEILAAAGGLMAAGVFMRFKRNPGLATLVGMIVFYVVSS